VDAFDRIDFGSMPDCDFALHFEVIVEEGKQESIVNARTLDVITRRSTRPPVWHRLIVWCWAFGHKVEPEPVQPLPATAVRLPSSIGGSRLSVFGAGSRRGRLCRLPSRRAADAGILLRLGLSPQAKVLDLQTRVRCRGCGARRRAVVSIKWRREVS
jgi:hypothetical protein